VRCASFYISPACIPALALINKSLTDSLFVFFKFNKGRDGAQPLPGVKGDAIVAFGISVGYTKI